MCIMNHRQDQGSKKCVCQQTRSLTWIPDSQYFWEVRVVYVYICVCGVGVSVEILSHAVDQRTNGAFALGEIPAQTAVHVQQDERKQKASQTNIRTEATCLLPASSSGLGVKWNLFVFNNAQDSPMEEGQKISL